MYYSKQLSSFSGATILNSQIFNNITPYFNTNIVFIILFSILITYLISDCKCNTKKV